eukprot:gene24910-30373_t
MIEHYGMLFATWSVMLSLLSYEFDNFSEASRLFVLLYWLGVCLVGLLSLWYVWNYGHQTTDMEDNDKMADLPGDGQHCRVVINEPEYPPVKRRCASVPAEKWTQAMEVHVHDHPLYPVEALTWKLLHTYTFGHLEVNLCNYVTLDGLTEAFPQILRQTEEGWMAKLARKAEQAREPFLLWVEHHVLKPYVRGLFTNIDLKLWGKHADYEFTIKSQLQDPSAYNDLFDWLERVCMPNLVCLEMTWNNLCSPNMQGAIMETHEVAGIDALRAALDQETACMQSVNLLRNQLAPADAE